MTDLPHVVEGDPHPQAHNLERDAINQLRVDFDSGVSGSDVKAGQLQTSFFATFGLTNTGSTDITLPRGLSIPIENGNFDDVPELEGLFKISTLGTQTFATTYDSVASSSPAMEALSSGLYHIHADVNWYSDYNDNTPASHFVNGDINKNVTLQVACARSGLPYYRFGYRSTLAVNAQAVTDQYVYYPLPDPDGDPYFDLISIEKGDRIVVAVTSGTTAGQTLKPGSRLEVSLQFNILQTWQPASGNTAVQDTGWRSVAQTGANYSNYVMRRVGKEVHFILSRHDDFVNQSFDVFPPGFRPSTGGRTLNYPYNSYTENGDAVTQFMSVYTAASVNGGSGQVGIAEVYRATGNEKINGLDNFSGSFLTDDGWPLSLPGVAVDPQ